MSDSEYEEHGKTRDEELENEWIVLVERSDSTNQTHFPPSFLCPRIQMESNGGGFWLSSLSITARGSDKYRWVRDSTLPTCERALDFGDSECD